jgi:catechol 2,3-dioxygenase-like lactoylglutathione lyase family enzyme
MPRTTLDHVTIVTDDFEASRPVYDAVLGAIGLAPRLDFEDPEGDADDTGTVAAVGYATEDGSSLLWLVAGHPPTVGAHLAFAAVDRSQVELAWQAAQNVGAKVIQAPSEWESAQLNYYGTQLADPAGNIIEMIFPTRLSGLPSRSSGPISGSVERPSRRR